MAFIGVFVALYWQLLAWFGGFRNPSKCCKGWKNIKMSKQSNVLSNQKPEKMSKVLNFPKNIPSSRYRMHSAEYDQCDCDELQLCEYIKDMWRTCIVVKPL